MNILYIDTRDNKKNIVRLKIGEKEFVETTDVHSLADGVLVLVYKVVSQAGIEMKDINSIYCEKGPGSYTGLRVGFAIANALSLALSIPLNDNKVGTIDTPVYE